MPVRNRVLAFLLFVLAACSNSEPAYAPTPYGPTVVKIPLSRDGHSLRVAVILGGVHTDAVLDTGASFTTCTLIWALENNPVLTTSFEVVGLQVVGGATLAAKTYTTVGFAQEDGVVTELPGDDHMLLLTPEHTSLPCLIGLDTLDQFDSWSIAREGEATYLVLRP